MGTMINRRRVCGGKKVILPSGYKQLKYIESTGTQYIDTGVIADNNLQLELEFQYTDLSITEQMGAIKGLNGTYIRHHLQKYQGFIYYGYGGIAYLLEENNLRKHFLSVKDDYIQYDSSTFSISTTPFSTYINYYLFARNAINLSVTYSKIRIYYINMVKSNVLVRNYIPCINPQNVVGMYDTVSQTFFANAGTGDFIAGPEV